MTEYITADEYRMAMRVVFPVLAIILAAMFSLWKMVHNEINEFKDAVKIQSERSDTLHKEFIEQSGQQSKRSDKLYEMFIDLLKEGKP